MTREAGSRRNGAAPSRAQKTVSRKLRGATLRLRLSLVVLAAFSLALLLSDLMSYYGIPFVAVEGKRGTNQSRNIEALAVAARGATARFDAWIAKARATLPLLASAPPGSALAVFKDEFVGFSAWDATGNPLVSEGEASEYLRLVPAARMRDDGAIELRESDRSTGKGLCLVLAWKGVLRDAVSGDYGARLTGMSLEAVDVTGRVLVASDSGGGAFASRIERWDEGSLAELRGATTATEIRLPDGRNAFAAAGHPSGGTTGLLFVARVSEFDLLLEAAKRRARLAFLDAIAAGLGVLAVLLLASGTFRVIHALAASAADISEGKLDTPLPRAPKGELGTLVNSFAAMLARLRSWYGELERAVAERTGELELRNRVADCFLGHSWEDAMEGLGRVLSDSLGCGPVEARYFGKDAPDRGGLASLGGVPVRGATGFRGEFAAPGANEDARATLGRVAAYVAPLFDARYRGHGAELERARAEAAVRQSEERFRAFFEQAPDPVILANEHGTVVAMNRAAESQFGQEWKTEPLPFAEFIVDDYNRNYFVACLAEHRSVRDLEAPMRTRWNETIEALLTARAIEDRGETIVFVKDVTERAQAERALWKTNEALAATNSELRGAQLTLIKQAKLASIGLLAAGIAHEINNPLGFLKSNAETLGRYARGLGRFAKAALELASGPEREKLVALAGELDIDFALQDLDPLAEEGREGFRRIVEIIGALRNFAREDLSPEYSLYDVNRGLDSSVAMAMNEIKYVAEIERDYGEVPLVPARGNEINQVFLNLLVNAAQAIAEKRSKGGDDAAKGVIRLSTGVRDGFAVVRVADDGVGMTRETQEKVFDPFFTTKEPGKGTGLGLSITYDIVVNKHSGDIKLDSEPGAGSAFTVFLPLSRKSPGADS